MSALLPHTGSQQQQLVQFPIHIKRLVRLDFHLPHSLARHHALAIRDRRLEFVAPRTAPAVSVAIVVAAEEVSLGLPAFFDGEGDVDGLEEVLGERGRELAEQVDVLGRVFGVQTAEEISGRTG